MKKTTRKARRAVSRKRQQHVTPIQVIRPSADALNRITRFRAERDMLASALEGAPPLNYDAEGREPAPFNSIASTDAMRRALLKVIARRNTFPLAADLFRAVDQTPMFGDYLDAYRNAAFMAGVEYAMRSLPAWWPSYVALSDDLRRHVGVVVVATARKDGE